MLCCVAACHLLDQCAGGVCVQAVGRQLQPLQVAVEFLRAAVVLARRGRHLLTHLAACRVVSRVVLLCGGVLCVLCRGKYGVKHQIMRRERCLNHIYFEQSFYFFLRATPSVHLQLPDAQSQTTTNHSQLIQQTAAAVKQRQRRRGAARRNKHTISVESQRSMKPFLRTFR